MEVHLVILLLYINLLSAYQVDVDDNEDTPALLNVVGKHGYTLDIHKVVTEDGYILTTFRLHRRSASQELLPSEDGTSGTTTGPSKPVIFLMHGIMSSAYEYVSGGPDKSIGYMFVERGYDVWLGNVRGTIFSRKHLRLNADRGPEFWNYSLQELGVYDLPANVDYIRNITGQPRINYLGNSQGTMAFFVMCSERPEYNERINKMIAFAPVAYLTHIKGIPRAISSYAALLTMMSRILNIYEIVPRLIVNVSRIIITTLCGNDVIRDLCVAIQLSIVDNGNLTAINFDKLKLNTYIKFSFTGASVKQLTHLAQNVLSGNFQQYDYGREENLKRYHATTPPHYNVSKVTAAVAIFYGDQDIFADKQDLERLRNELPNVIEYYKVPYESFSHYDYLVARGIENVLYSRVFKILASETNNSETLHAGH